MPIKTTKVSRWEVTLEAENAATPSLAVNSIDGDEKYIRLRLGDSERILSVEDWMALVNAVRGNVKYEATR